MERRTARCCCGDLSITVTGEPRYIHRCSCDHCQRRTGSVFQVSCWYPEAQVAERKGEFRVYQGRPRLERAYGQVGREAPEQVIDHKFCVRCGSTVYWEIPLPPGTLGPEEVIIVAIAVGCFFEADFPMPDEDHYVQDRHAWIPPIEGAAEFQTMPPAQDLTPEME